MSRDLVTGLVCLIGSLVLLALTIGLAGPSLLVPIGPGFYPRIILAISAVLSAALVIQALLARRKKGPGPGPGPNMPKGVGPNYGLVVASFAVFGVYVVLMPLLGFRIATFIFMLACQPLLEPVQTTKGWIVAVIVAAITSFVTFHLFQDYLSVLLPRGRWTDF